jgi:dTMP kinase
VTSALPGWPGFFVTFEGGEGVGKTTQIRRLAETLRAQGHEAVVTREPGGSPAAERIRDILLDGSLALDVMTQLMLFSAARRDHWRKTIEPALEAGGIILCDRFFDSTAAYQGAAGVLPKGAFAALTGYALGEARPDLTLILDLDPAIGLARVALRRGAVAADSFEGRDPTFHETVRGALLAIGHAEPERCVIIDAGQDESTVEREIRSIVARKLRDRGA